MAKKQTENQCPYCGGTQGYTVNVRVSGYWRFEHFWNGDADSSNTDGIIYHKEPKTGRCLDCGQSVEYIVKI